METCEQHGGNVVVVYEKMGCPLCDAEAQIDTWEKQNSKQSGMIEDLEDEIEQLKKQITEIYDAIRNT